ncbi:DedA family protein [Caldicellulosiruptor naganoensis]|uniref:VTT domain-containing protein n=1 Tax=Caldicellulosiruptor naganoensis TaxID=29324 RepID=A0ABY7BF77_9FIRM|nr:VTT domain-containing protein [Caldicellulosiruptor naganoensis]WAM31259.1 VTT domain-containing protein [Caldicellulosiruptor naganoensis]
MIGLLKYLVDKYGIIGIFLILLIEGLGIPFPTQIAYFGAVALLNLKKYNPFTLIMVISLGNLCGNLIINLLLRSGRNSIVNLFEKLLRIKKETLSSVNNFFVKYGIFAVPIARIIGVPRTPVIFLAGISKMNFYEYVISSFIGDTIWATFYVYFYWYGFSFFKLLYERDISLFWAAIFFLVAVVVLVWTIVLKILAKKKKV